MNQEIRAYLRLEATVAAAFNFFINGMVSALIYHKADSVPFDAVSIAIDLLLTCFFIFTVTVFFCRASLRRTKTYGILKNDTIAMHYLSRLFNYPVLFGVLLGIFTAMLLFVLIAPAFVLLHIDKIPFGWYIVFKTTFCAFLGYGVTLLEMYSGMCTK